MFEEKSKRHLLVNLKEKKIERFLTGGKTKLLRLAVCLDGVPHVSSVWYLWDGKYFWISTAEDRLKVRAALKNPNVALIIDTDVQPYEGVIVEGKASLTKARLKAITYEIVKRYVPKSAVNEEFKELMRAPRILIRIKPEKVLDIMSYKEH